MSVTVELSELDADLWEAFKNGGTWVAHSEYMKLRAENAKLRNEVDNLMDFEHLTSVAVAYAGCDECGEYKQTMLRLFDENAKLRELVNGWNFCSKTKISTFDDCVGCPLFIQTPHSYRCARDERMRELGVEVTE